VKTINSNPNQDLKILVVKDHQSDMGENVNGLLGFDFLHWVPIDTLDLIPLD
jgi:hypothetical protein